IAAGGRPKNGPSTNRVVVLAKACHEIVTSSTSAQRICALTGIGLSLQRLHRDRGVAKSVEAQYLEHLGLTKSAYRELCLRFAVLVGEPTGMSPKMYRSQIIQAADILGIALDRQRLKTPSADAWSWDSALKVKNL